MIARFARERHPGLRVVVLVVVGAVMAACAHPAFQRYIAEGRWDDARAELKSDTTLQHNDWALLQASRLYSSPDRGEYDLAKARVYLEQLIARNPPSQYRADAVERLALIDGIARQRDSIDMQRHTLDARIAQLTDDARKLRVSLDSAIAKNDTVQRGMSRLEADLRDRDEQLRALRLELARLKAIDLNPRPAARPPQR